MVMSIIAACTAAVQLGMGAGSAAADFAGEKISAAYNTNDLNVFLWNHHNALDYFLLFGCSDTQRSTYWTVSEFCRTIVVVVVVTVLLFKFYLILHRYRLLLVA